MTNPQAKEILLRYRPGIDDPKEAEVEQALEAVRVDPDLEDWLERQRAWQGALRNQLRRISAPAGLREQIVAEVKAEVHVGGRSRLAAVAMVGAALFVVLGWFLFFQSPLRKPTFETFRARMVKKALRGYTMDLATNDLVGIRRYLTARRAAGDASLPAGLRAMAERNAVRPLGCALLKWQNRPVAMFCFSDPERRPLWLFVVDDSAVPGAPPRAVTQFKRVNKLMTASWRLGGRTYLLASPVTKADLKAYL